MSENSIATRKMKYSGVEWIGEIPEDWEIICVRHLFRIGRGRVIAQTELKEDGEFPVYSSQTMSDGCLGYLDTYDFDADQLTWTTDGANAGTVFLRRGKYNCTNVCGTLLPCSPKIEIRYQKYSLEYISFYHKRADTNGYKIMNNEMAAIKTIVPPIDTQHRIADFLDDKCGKIDQYIEKQQRIIDKLKEYKQAVITEAVTKGLNPDVPMKDSGIEWIGMIPEHWKVLRVKQCSTTCSGGTPNSNETSLYDGDINWVCSFDLNEKEIYSTVKTLSQKGADSIAGDIQLPNSILIAMYGGGGTIGNSGLLKCEARTNQAVCSVHFEETVFEPKYAFYHTIFLRKYWMYFAVGTRKDPNISQDTIKQMKYVCPPITEQKAIVQLLEKECAKIDSAISKQTSIIEKLTEYKKSLIYEAVTGKLEV